MAKITNENISEFWWYRLLKTIYLLLLILAFALFLFILYQSPQKVERIPDKTKLICENKNFLTLTEESVEKRYEQETVSFFKRYCQYGSISETDLIEMTNSDGSTMKIQRKSLPIYGYNMWVEKIGEEPYISLNYTIEHEYKRWYEWNEAISIIFYGIGSIILVFYSIKAVFFYIVTGNK